MPEFVMQSADAPEFQALDAFTQGYIEALFFTEEEGLCEESGRDMPAVAFNLTTMESRFVGGDAPGFADLAPDALAQIVSDCEAFQRDNAALLALAYERDDYDATQAGRDYWYTRNGHGVGFWDREQLAPDTVEYEALTDAMVAARDDRKAWAEALAKRNEIKEQGLGERLSKACRGAGRDAYIGDDGKVHLS
jgi:hypothetical protein